MGMFTTGNSILDDESVLFESYTPDTFVEREEERDEYTHALSSIARDVKPRNIFVYGRTGVGKSLATEIILDALVEESQEWDQDVAVTRVSCEGKSSYDATISIINELRDDGDQISNTGYRTATVNEMMFDEINGIDEDYMVLVLDEIDKLGDSPGLLYQLPRARDEGNLDDTKVNIIGISNDFTFREELEPKIQSTLCETEIRFAPYESQELISILEDRAEDAFVDGVLEEDLIPYIAARTAQDTGSARQAMDILLEAGHEASKTDAERVTVEHAKTGIQEVEKNRIMNELRDLTLQGHLMLYAIALFEENGTSPVRRKEIYAFYKKLAEHFGYDVNSGKTVLKRLNELSANGFLSLSQINIGRQGGRHNQYEMDMKHERFMTVLREEGTLFDEDEQPERVGKKLLRSHLSDSDNQDLSQFQ